MNRIIVKMQKSKLDNMHSVSFLHFDMRNPHLLRRQYGEGKI
jgi:hypothetical protein